MMHQMSIMHLCRPRHRWTAHGSWPQMARRTIAHLQRQVVARSIHDGAPGTIARLQQRDLAADGAPQNCAPAAARAGRRWRTTSTAENTNRTTGTRAIKRKAMEDMLVQALLTVRKGKAQMLATAWAA